MISESECMMLNSLALTNPKKILLLSGMSHRITTIHTRRHTSMSAKRRVTIDAVSKVEGQEELAVPGKQMAVGELFG
jgi:hypothetical protein